MIKNIDKNKGGFTPLEITTNKTTRGEFKDGRKMEKFITQKSKAKFLTGFTLIETFVAITILLIAVIGPMSIIAKFYANSTYAKNQIAATFLAQDGMETVINIIRNNTELRRNAIAEGSSCTDTAIWLSGAEACRDGCNADSLSGTVNSCSVVSPDDGISEGCNLFTNSEGNYTTAEGETSIFVRQVKITNIDETEIIEDDFSTLRRAAQVTAKVWWQEKGKLKGPVTVSSLVMQNQCP